LKTTLSHLPDHKKDQLKALTEIIRAKVPAEMIILFGSYARGGWVEDYQEKYEYVSDFDILVITKDRISAKRDKKWRELDRELINNKDITRTSIIQHSIGFVNDKIERNNYFFVDILKEGIVLFDSGNCSLSEPKALNPAERHEKAINSFTQWFKSGNDFEKYAVLAIQNSDNSFAAFNLHQAVERYYTTILLVFTDYKPKIHDIEILGNQIVKLDPEFAFVFPKNTAEEERRFQLLKKAYIDARYEMNYKIEKEDLEYLAGCVKMLRVLTERICNERIAEFAED
jgi:uncharacterized protein